MVKIKVGCVMAVRENQAYYGLIYIVRSENYTWGFGLHYRYGVAGGCYGLSGYAKHHWHMDHPTEQNL